LPFTTPCACMMTQHVTRSEDRRNGLGGQKQEYFTTNASECPCRKVQITSPILQKC
jgi:hypothetical protein